MATSHRYGFALLFCVAISLSLVTHIEVQADVVITGRVTDDHGAPLAATVTQFLGASISKSVVCSSDGNFNISTGAGVSRLLIYYDNPSTPGFDYLPAIIKVNPTSSLTIMLQPAASVSFGSNLQFVDTDNLPSGVMFSIRDEGGNLLNQTGFPLYFGSPSGGVALPTLPSYTVVVPAESSFRVSLVANILVGNKIESRTIETGDMGPVHSGALLKADVRNFSIPYNFGLVEGLDSGVRQAIIEMEGKGFYLVRERGLVAQGEAEVASSKDLFSTGRLTESFDLLKTGYLGLRGVQVVLGSLQADASVSVYVLIGFFALASTVSGFVVVDNMLKQAGLSVAVFLPSMTFLYLLYPGSRSLPLGVFSWASMIAIVTFLSASVLLPRLLATIGGGDRVGLVDVLIPVMSIAKRNLKRRKLRLALTLVSLIVMVMGFVSLTSFAGGYGLLTHRVSVAPSDSPRVLLRSGSWSTESATSLPAGSTEIAWLTLQEGVDFAAQKLETTPPYVSPISVSGKKLMGIVGIQAILEQKSTDLKNALESGNLPVEGGIALSAKLAEELRVGLGDKVNLYSMDFILQGVFNDARLYSLTDIDGNNYLPFKWVNTSPKDEPPIYSLQECEANEVVLIDTSAAELIPLTHVSRITIGLSKVDPYAFAKRIALERGYQAWAAGPEGVWLESVGSYIDAKGLPLIVPWAIVALNVVVTTLSGLYERRREIGILSSVGLNPAEISAIFVSEAAVTAFIAGGLGYLAGFGLYRSMLALGLALEVEQKVSATWAIAAVALSVSAVLVGAFAALRGSLVITPSLTRRWKVGQAKDSLNARFEVPVPLRLAVGEREDFISYINSRLHGLENDPVRKTSRIKVVKEGESTIISFIYRSSQTTTGNFYTSNRAIVESDGEGGFRVRLESVGDAEWVHDVGALIRLIAMEWSGRKRESSVN